MALIQQLVTYLMLLLLLLAKMLEHHKEPHVLLVVADGVYAHRDWVLIDFNQFCINFPVGPAALLKRQVGKQLPGLLPNGIRKVPSHNRLSLFIADKDRALFIDAQYADFHDVNQALETGFQTQGPSEQLVEIIIIGCNGSKMCLPFTVLP